MRKPAALLVVACACAIGCVAVGCGSPGMGAGGSASDAAGPATASEAAGTVPADAETQAVTAAELTAVDVSIEYGDYDGMAALASEIQNGKRTGQVVEIDGIVSNFARGMTYNIMEPNADGSQKVGTVFVIDGVEDRDEQDVYPADETRARITGKVGIDTDGIYYLIHTLPDYVEVQPT